jgi:hypothetical protein
MNECRTVGFEFPSAVTMNTIVFWGVTPCSLVEVHRRFEERTASISESKFKPSSKVSARSVKNVVRCIRFQVLAAVVLGCNFQRATRHYIPEDRTLLG